MSDTPTIDWIAPIADFDALSPAEKRVAIARDVLKGVQTRRLTPVTDSYSELNIGDPDRAAQLIASDASLRDVLPTLQSCKVCAIGAAGMAVIGRVNQFGMHHFEQKLLRAGDELYKTNRAEVDDDALRETLVRYFTPLQIAMMECAYMKSTSFANYQPGVAFRTYVLNDTVCDNKAIHAAVAFGYQFDADDERLSAIWQNVIDNNGEFVP